MNHPLFLQLHSEEAISDIVTQHYQDIDVGSFLPAIYLAHSRLHGQQGAQRLELSIL